MSIFSNNTTGFPCHKVLPLIFDESLSYYEMICKIIKIVENNTEELDNLEQISQNADAVYRGGLLGITAYQKPNTGIPASDLASGVIPTALSQLSGDSTHRTATDEEKNTWNGKQNALGYTPENISNKATSISSSSTDTQYPSAKAVYSFIQSLDGNGVEY